MPSPALMQDFLGLPASLKAEILLYPFFLLFRLPAAWAQSLWEARRLFNGQWSRYMGFHPYNAINSLFYRTQWLNLDRYGRNGISPLLGLGNFPLSTWFHLSLPASYIFSNAGAVTTLLSTLLWSLGNFLWLNNTNWSWSLLIVFLLLFSTTSYSMAFVRQNYQMLGWMWLPVSIYYTLNGAYIPASLSWLVASMAGITQVFFSFPIVILAAIISHDPFLPIVVVPATAYVATLIIPAIADQGFAKPVLAISKLIGLTSSKTRYKYYLKDFDIQRTYFIGLYVICLVLFWLSTYSFPLFPALAVLLFVLNEKIARVADQQSMIVICASIFCFSFIQSPPSIFTAATAFLAFNPAPFFLGIQQLRNTNIDKSLIVHPPFDHLPLQNVVDSFLSEIPSHQSVYFAFENPNGRFFNIFDGYRCIHELSLYVASLRSIHLFPDWYAVMQTNAPDAPNCWGRGFHDVLENCSKWGASYVIIYINSSLSLDTKWLESFRVVSSLDWQDYIHYFRGVEIWPRTLDVPKWYLLQRI